MKTIIRDDSAIITKENILFPIYLRVNTTDLHVFHQIFIRGDYEINLQFNPAN